ncbi:MAG: helix-turn-helix domain-containing protein [Alphaproteobacteria bacterium]|nr:helix-turn-helix domain-containing protein [Alphaproteobacteria bacterium]
MPRETGQPTPARTRRHEIWRTSDVAEAERFSYFREAVCEAFMDLSPEHDLSRPFDAVVESIPLAGGAVNRVRGTPHQVQRTKAQIGRSFEQCFFLNIQLQSECLIEQRGREVRLAPGQVALFGSDRPFRIFHPPEEDMSVASFWLPRALVEESFPDRQVPDIGRVSDHPFLGPPIAAAARALNRGGRAMGASDAGLLLESLVRLAARAASGNPDRYPGPETVGPALLAAILEYVESRLHDPDLGVAEAAAQFGIGKRYVHKLFEPTGQTFSRHVTERRLERVAADLTAPELARMPIAGIAWRNGFSDLSHFNRRFRERYGATPRDIRRSGGFRTDEARLTAHGADRGRKGAPNNSPSASSPPKPVMSTRRACT